jgi:hypothetical protein
MQSNLDAERAAWLLAKNNALAEAQASSSRGQTSSLLGLDADDLRHSASRLEQSL